MRILDYFEDSFYERRTLYVMSSKGEHLPAEIYLVPSQRTDILSPLPWDPDKWKAKYLESYIPRCQNYRREYFSQKSRSKRETCA